MKNFLNNYTTLYMRIKLYIFTLSRKNKNINPWFRYLPLNNRFKWTMAKFASRFFHINKLGYSYKFINDLIMNEKGGNYYSSRRYYVSDNSFSLLYRVTGFKHSNGEVKMVKRWLHSTNININMVNTCLYSTNINTNRKSKDYSILQKLGFDPKYVIIHKEVAGKPVSWKYRTLSYISLGMIENITYKKCADFMKKNINFFNNMPLI